MARKKPVARIPFSSPEALKLKEQIRTLYAQKNPELTWRQIGLKFGVSKSVVERALKGVPKRQAPDRIAYRINKMKRSMKKNKKAANTKMPHDIEAANYALAKSNSESSDVGFVMRRLQDLFPGVRRFVVDMDKRQLFAERTELVPITSFEE